MKRSTALSLAALIAILSLGATQASATTPRVCPDGTVVSCTKKCPKTKKIRAGTTLPGRNAKAGLGLTSAGGQHKGKAPKPGDSAKKWRDYINGNPKPPVRPKN